MKTRFTYFFTMVLAMVLSLSFSACSDDDDETMVDESSIIGLWYESSDSSVSFEFRNDGTVPIRRLTERYSFGSSIRALSIFSLFNAPVIHLC